MKDVRPWIAVLALVSFLAGVAASTLHQRLDELDDERGPFSAYADQFAEHFELSEERAARLRALLVVYADEIERIRDAHEVDFYASLERELRPKGAEFDRYIRDYVLPPSQRSEFDRLANGASVPTAPRN